MRRVTIPASSLIPGSIHVGDEVTSRRVSLVKLDEWENNGIDRRSQKSSSPSESNSSMSDSESSDSSESENNTDVVKDSNQPDSSKTKSTTEYFYYEVNQETVSKSKKSRKRVHKLQKKEALMTYLLKALDNEKEKILEKENNWQDLYKSDRPSKRAKKDTSHNSENIDPHKNDNITHERREVRNHTTAKKIIDSNISRRSSIEEFDNRVGQSISRSEPKTVQNSRTAWITAYGAKRWAVYYRYFENRYVKYKKIPKAPFDKYILPNHKHDTTTDAQLSDPPPDMDPPSSPDNETPSRRVFFKNQ